MPLYTDSLNYINNVCDSYVGENVAAVAGLIGPFAASMLTLYVILWSFASFRGLIREPFDDFLKRLITISVVFGIGFSLANYNILITNTFLRGPDEFVAGLAQSAGTGGVVSGLDAMLEQGFEIGGRFWAKAGLLDGDFGMYFVALFVWFLTLVVTAYAFFLMALSKFVLTVLVGLGALFFLGLLFEATAGFFNAWLRQLANYFLVPVLVVMVNLLIMKLFARAASGAAAITSTTEVAQVFPFAAMGLVSLLALGVNNEIVFVEHCPPIFCRKIWYWQRPVFLHRANRRLPTITPIEIKMPPSPPPLQQREGSANAKARTPRDITPPDVTKLGKLKLTDYAADFKNIQLPKGETLTSDDLEKTFDSFIKAVQA